MSGVLFNAAESIELPRLVRGLPIEAYHAHPSISKSGLDLIAKSPFHYAASKSPDAPPEKPRRGLEGNLAHCALLEPEAFGERYPVGPDCNRNEKKWKDWAAAEVKPGQTAIKPAERDVALRQAESMRAIPAVRAALEEGWTEVSAFWRDPKTGVVCRCRPDLMRPVGDSLLVLLDVKTYASANPAAFGVQAGRMRYHVQDAFYTQGVELVTDREVAGFFFVAVEDKFPFAASLISLDAPSKARGKEEARRDLDRYAASLESRVWPGYGDDVHVASIPAYAFFDEE